MSLKDQITRITAQFSTQCVSHDHYSILDPEPLSFPGDIAWSGEEVVQWHNPEDGEIYSLSAYTAKECGMQFK